MPRIYERSFTIRHYECDAEGKVSDANYLRFMQEAAYSGSADAGYDMVGYRAMGRQWFIRETEVKFLKSLHYGDQILVRTWVKDFHRVRSVRAYEMINSATCEVAATAWSDWVFLDSKTGMPSSIPKEMIEAFIPDADERVEFPRKRFPPVEQPASGVFGQERRVEWRDLDPVGHVNNAVYCAYCHECSLAANLSKGWTTQRLAEYRSQPISLELQIEYRQSARYSDLLTIHTWISQCDASTLTRSFTITRKDDGELMSQARWKYQWMNPETGSVALAPIDWLYDMNLNIEEKQDE